MDVYSSALQSLYECLMNLNVKKHGLNYYHPICRQHHLPMGIPAGFTAR